jgi:hypothetical protein
MSKIVNPSFTTPIQNSLDNILIVKKIKHVAIWTTKSCKFNCLIADMVSVSHEPLYL